MLTQKRLKELLHYNKDKGVFKWKVDRNIRIRKGDTAGCKNKDGYNTIVIDTKTYYAHRLAWLYMTGEWPKYEVDHDNRDRGDNRWVNLKSVTRTKNMANKNKYKNNTSGVTGVYYNKQFDKWFVKVTRNGKSTFKGYFEDKNEAIKVRKSLTP